MCIYKNYTSYKSLPSPKVDNKSDSGRYPHAFEVFRLFTSCSASGLLYKTSFLQLLLSHAIMLDCGVNHFMLMNSDSIPQDEGFLHI